MAQSIKISRNTASDPLQHRLCVICGQPARFVGLEYAPRDARSDLCTYQCMACEHVQTEVIPHKRANGVARH